MTQNPIGARLASGDTILNGWLHIPSSWSAEIMARAGWDSVTVDFQHGFHDVSGALAMLQAIEAGGATPLVRVNWNEPGMIMRMLDAGAMGVICPMIESAEQCAAFVGACRYPPAGYRSLGPTRPRLVYGADYAQRANDEVLAIAMIETVAALDSLDRIAAVDGLDGLFVGTGDLSLSLRAQQREDETEAALEQIAAAAAKHGLWSGLFTANPADVPRRRAQGFRFITVMTDVMLLAEHARAVIGQIRDTKE